MLPSDARPCDVAGHLVHVQSDLEPLLAGHLAVAFNLLLQCRGCIHGERITGLLQRSKIIQRSGTSADCRKLSGEFRMRRSAETPLRRWAGRMTQGSSLVPPTCRAEVRRRRERRRRRIASPARTKPGLRDGRPLGFSARTSQRLLTNSLIVSFSGSKNLE